MNLLLLALDYTLSILSEIIPLSVISIHPLSVQFLPRLSYRLSHCGE